VIAVGVLYEFGPLDDVAPAFPKTKFAGVDVDWKGLSSHAKNIRGIQFREQEAGYLVGYVAGRWIKDHKKAGHNVVGGVGANKVPAITRYLAGYKAGAKKAFPGVKVLIDYANDPTFADQAKCRETTLNHIDQGSRVEFEAAGACGLGGLNAAKQKKIWGVGVDANQGFLGKHMLTSALKHVELSVFNAIKQYKANPKGFKGGFNTNYTLKNHGVGFAPLSTKVPKKERTAITKATNHIGQGSRVEFQVAGACGLGGLNAAKQKNIWGIGVDANQGFLGKHILTSALKHVEVSVFNAIKQYKANPKGFKGGFNSNYTLKNGGVGFAPLSTKVPKAERAAITKATNHIAKLIIQGKIKVPSH